MTNYEKSFKNNIIESEESKNKISKFISGIDKLFKKKYDDIDTNTYFNIIKDKPNKTPYAYALKICNNINITCILSIYFSIRYTNPMYNIICFVNDTNIYEKNNIGDTYLKYDKISDNNINVLKELFDVVISTNMFLIKCDKLSNHMHYDFYNIYGYISYSKILIITESCLINKNIDFLFDKYEQSTYMIT